MADFAQHIEDLVTLEGGYRVVRLRDDRGGRTYAGISQRSNPDWAGWDIIESGQTSVADLRTLVHARYRLSYWDPICGDELPDCVVQVLFPAAVLSGVRTAARLAQRVVGANVDGVIGPQTVGAIINYGEFGDFRAAFGLAQIARFLDIVQADPDQRQFFLGWSRRVVRTCERREFPR